MRRRGCDEEGCDELGCEELGGELWDEFSEASYCSLRFF